MPHRCPPAAPAPLARPGTHRRLTLLLGLTAILALTGCRSAAYSRGTADQYFTSPRLAARPQIEHGRPNAFVDGFGWVWGIPPKILLFDRRVENHRVSRTTEQALTKYLAHNELHSVKVRVNQYNPRDDWKRLTRNTAVGGGWRYTLGALSVAGETLFPGRLFGGDHYNPFTNTIHLYSDVPAIAIHEGGHAKDFATREWKGTWAAAYLIPGAPLWHESIATSDALTWLAEQDDPQALREGYHILYPAYGTYAGSVLSDPSGISYLAGVLAGHAAGRWQASRIDDRPTHRKRETPADSQLPRAHSSDPGQSTKTHAKVHSADQHSTTLQKPRPPRS
ncbi:MAG: hypothetical protein ACKO2P_19080 [Planctomycetota bacterium]